MTQNTESSHTHRIRSTPQSDPLISSANIKQAATFLLGAWAIKRFPKTAVVGLIGVGVILGLTLKEVAKRVELSPRKPDDLH